MIKLLITAGGTATAWHMANVIQNYFSDSIELHICDINPVDLVPSATLANRYHRVPPIKTLSYKKTMLELLKEEEIQVIIPLIDQDLEIFSCDDKELSEIGVSSTGPLRETFRLLSNKRKLCDTLLKLGIPTIPVVHFADVEADKKYILKPTVGCGSRGVRCVSGNLLLEEGETDDVIQEFCELDAGEKEVTAEIFNPCQGTTEVFCRQRIETKAGVCTKMRPVRITEIEEAVRTLVQKIECPRAFCAQFLPYRGQWCLIDCNLRIGAGTALSTAVGFQLVRAFIATIIGEQVPESWLKIDKKVRSVVRVYDEVVMR